MFGRQARHQKGSTPAMRVSPRGRAILQPIATETASERTYRPGDFVLTHSRGSLAWSMGVATASWLNQAALIVDSSGGLIEVNPFFVSAWGGLRRSHINEYLGHGAPVLVGVGAPTSLAVDLAGDRGLTLCGFARGGRVNVYTHAGRVLP